MFAIIHGGPKRYEIARQFFAITLYSGPHGDTVTSDNPKLDAYKQAAYVMRMGRNYRLTAHEDGHYTIAGDGLEPITFAPAE